MFGVFYSAIIFRARKPCPFTAVMHRPFQRRLRDRDSSRQKSKDSPIRASASPSTPEFVDPAVLAMRKSMGSTSAEVHDSMGGNTAPESAAAHADARVPRCQYMLVVVDRANARGSTTIWNRCSSIAGERAGVPATWQAS
jgi:hypothetical protein